MKQFFQIITLYIAIFAASSTWASTSEQIQGRINQVLKQYNPTLNIGIMAKSITSGQTIYEKNAKQLFLPASILKILPAIASLAFLGPNYHFQTKVLTKSVYIDGGMINNDLYFYFDGDPFLTHQQVDGLIKRLAALGLKTVNGNIYIDDTIFDDSLIGAGWAWEDLNSCYAAPIGSIIIDKNCFALRLRAAGPEKPAILINATTLVSITNGVVSKQPGPADGCCPLKLHASSNNDYYLSGCLKTNAKPVDLSFAIRNVRLYARNLLFEKFQTNNIKVTGRIEFKKIPQNAPLEVLAEHQSLPLTELIKTMLKKSDNTIADAIFKKLGFMFFKRQATWQNGATAVKNILATKTSTSFKEMYMDDGSGLSLHNLITPEIFVNALNYAYRDETIRPNFVESLSRAGIDGTLQYRMPHLKYHIYAKTGNISGASSLAGYIKTKNQEWVAFAIIINSFLDSPRKYHKLQNDICTILANG